MPAAAQGDARATRSSAEKLESGQVRSGGYQVCNCPLDAVSTCQIGRLVEPVASSEELGLDDTRSVAQPARSCLRSYPDLIVGGTV
jgi:hypothetical protein